MAVAKAEAVASSRFSGCPPLLGRSGHLLVPRQVLLLLLYLMIMSISNVRHNFVTSVEQLSCAQFNWAPWWLHSLLYLEST